MNDLTKQELLLIKKTMDVILDLPSGCDYYSGQEWSRFDKLWFKIQQLIEETK